MMARGKIRRAIGFVIPYFIGIITYISYFLPASAQPVTFEKIYDYGLAEGANCVQQTLDGGFILAGRQGVAIGITRLILIKTDSLGVVEWERFYGNPGFEMVAHSIRQTTDGGFIISGYKTDVGKGSDILLMKIANDGDSIWAKNFGTADYENGWEVTETFDKGYVVACTWSADSACLIKTNNVGDLVWRKTYMPNGHHGSVASAIVQLPDSGFYFTGATEPVDIVGDVYIVRTDRFGETIWSRSVGGADNEKGQSIDMAKDGGAVVAGYTWSYGAGDYDIYLIRLNSQGDTLWTRTYGTARQNAANCVRTSDDGYIVAGYSNNQPAAGWLIKIDSNGYKIWDRIFDERAAEYVVETSDKGYAICGLTRDANAYLIKMDSLGDVITDQPPNLQDPDFKVSIYPNPMRTKAYVEIQGVLLGTDWPTFTLFDQLGRVVRHQTLQTTQFVFERGGIPSGIYIYHIRHDQKVLWSGKIVIQ